MVTDEFGITEKEYKAIEEELQHLQSLGIEVLPVIVKWLPNSNGISGVSKILVHPNSNVEELKRTVAHEIGHHNQPADGVDFDLWTDEESGYLVEAYSQYAKEISWYAETNVTEFWAELFATVTRPDYIKGTIECDYLVTRMFK